MMPLYRAFYCRSGRRLSVECPAVNVSVSTSVWNLSHLREFCSWMSRPLDLMPALPATSCPFYTGAWLFTLFGNFRNVVAAGAVVLCSK